MTRQGRGHAFLALGRRQHDEALRVRRDPEPAGIVRRAFGQRHLALHPRLCEDVPANACYRTLADLHRRHVLGSGLNAHRSRTKLVNGAGQLVPEGSAQLA